MTAPARPSRLRVGLTYALLAALLAAVCLALVAVTAAPAAALVPLAVGQVTATTDLNELLKVYFEDSVVTNVVTDSEIMDLIEQDPEIQYEQTTGGRYIETAQMFALPAGSGARSEGDPIPVPNGPITKNSRIYLKKILGSLSMTGDTMRKVKSDEGAYLNYLERSMPALAERQTNDVDRMMIGFGAGAKARVSAIASNVITLKDSHGIVGYGEAFLNFLEGETVVFGTDIAGQTLRGNAGAKAAKVKNVSQNGNSITLVDDSGNAFVPVGVAVGDFIFEGDNASGGGMATAAGDQREFMGLLGHVDDGSIVRYYQSIDRQEFDKWGGTVIDAGSEVANAGILDEDAISYADDKTRIGGGGKVKVLVASASGQRAFWRSLRQDRTLPNPKAYTGGKGGVTMQLGDRVVEVRSARKMPHNICFGLTTSTFKRHEIGKVEWDNTTGAIWKQATNGTAYLDAFWAYNHRYLQVSCNAPRKNFVIRGLTSNN